MNAKPNTDPSRDAWEDRSVGAQEEFVQVAPDIEAALNHALDLQPISIRLQKNLIDNLKALAQLHGLGYQPLIRQILTRWVDAEVKQMIAQRANEMVAQGKAQAGRAPQEAVPKGARTPSRGKPTSETRQRRAA